MVCRQGEPAEGWVGVLDGLLRIACVDAAGGETTIAGIRAGGWFGEGTVLKREPFRYHAVALRRTRIAVLPALAFHGLLDRSLRFNRFVMEQLNERLGHYMATRELDRVGVPELRVERHLLELCDGVLHPGGGPVIRVTQRELADLVGLSRQRVNQALAQLQNRGVLRVEYGAVRIIDAAALASHDRGSCGDG